MPSIFDWVVPPVDAGGDKQRDWQWRVAMAIIGLYGAGIGAGMLAMGLVAGVGGFASRDAVQQTQDTVREIRLEQLRDRIDQTRIRQCQAIMESNRVAMNVLYVQMQQYVNQHFSLAQYQYRVPDCGELVPYTAGVIVAPTPVPTIRAGEGG